MPSTASLPHAGIEAALQRCQLGVDASEMHGLMTGFLCARPSDGVDSWCTALALECGREADIEATERLLAALAGSTASQLADPSMGFAPLLPAESEPLPRRARALVVFCRGLLAGYGLAGGGRAGSPEAREALDDIGRIAASREQFQDEDDEASLVELVEFVRVAVLLLFEERHGGGRSTESGS